MKQLDGVIEELKNAIECAKHQDGEAISCTSEWLEIVLSKVFEVYCKQCNNEGWVSTGVEHYGQQEMYACECIHGERVSQMLEFENEIKNLRTALRHQINSAQGISDVISTAIGYGEQVDLMAVCGELERMYKAGSEAL